MTQRQYKPADLSALRTYSIADRAHKVDPDRLAKLPDKGASASEFIDSFPGYLGANELRAIVDAIVAARAADRPVIAAMGAHVIKVGCGPIIVDLIRRNIITGLAFNGATVIHDAELALFGGTSEEVAETIADGTFGMVAETLAFFARVARAAQENNVGLGQAAGLLIHETGGPFLDASVVAAAVDAGIPVTVHVALGTDTIHVGPELDAAQFAAASMRDFKLLCSVVGDLGASSDGDAGGVWLNIGSAVILPEVFLKAVSVSRNLGSNLDAMVTANLDMIRHYRTRANVVTRPVKPGCGHEVIGHHEILLPLLRQAIVERI